MYKQTFGESQEAPGKGEWSGVFLADILRGKCCDEIPYYNSANVNRLECSVIPTLFQEHQMANTLAIYM